MNDKLLKEFCRHLCAYFFIIIIPVIVLNVAFRQYFLDLYKTEIIRQESRSLDRLQVFLDGKLSFIQKASNLLALNDCFSSMNMLNNPSSFYDIFSALNSINSLDSDITNIYYFNAKTSPDTLYSCKGTYNISTYPELNPAFFNGYNSTADRITRITVPTFLSVNENILLSGQPSIGYVIPVQNQSAYFIFSIKLSLFTEALGNIYQTDYIPYYDICSNGNMLYSNYPVYVPEDPIQTPPSSHRVETVHRNHYYISQIASSAVNLVYRNVIDETVLMQRLHVLYTKFLLLSVAVLLLGFVIIYLMTHRYYKPIRHLIESLEGFGLSLPSRLPALDQVTEGMGLLSACNKQLQYEQCLLKLLGGAYKDIDDFHTRTLCREILLNHSTYKVVTLSYEESREELGEWQEFDAEEIQIYTLDYGQRNLRIMLVFFAPHMEGALMEQLTSWKCNLDERLLPSYKVCVSRTYQILSDMPYALLECQKLSQDKRSVASLFIYPDDEGTYDETVHYPEETLTGLWDALSHKDSDKIQTCVNELIQYLLCLDDRHLLFLPLSYSITHTFNKASGIYHIPPRPISQLSSVSREQLIAYMTAYTSEVIGLIQLQQQESESSSVSAITDYIRKHYRECDLCVSSLADHFDLTVSNLSHQFKLSTGVNPSVFIDSLRLEYAKYLLETSSMTIREISEAVGYAQPSSFIRHFKQVTDITPGEWRIQSPGGTDQKAGQTLYTN